MAAVRLDQPQCEQQVHVPAQAIRRHTAAPHRQTVASSLQQFELIEETTAMPKDRRAAPAPCAKWAVSGTLSGLSRSAGLHGYHLPSRRRARKRRTKRMRVVWE